MSEKANIDVMIPTLNEQENLPFALRSVKDWARNVFVLDSGSTDQTEQIARREGAQFVHQNWLGYGRQKNWGLDNLPFESDWIFILDADEVIQPELRDEMISIASQPLPVTRESGYYVNRYLVFLGKRIRHCGYYPSWNLRFFKRGMARYEDRAVHEHMLVDRPCGYLHGHMEHHDRRGFDYYHAKHAQYAALEAQEIFRQKFQQDEQLIEPRLFGNPLARRRWFKRHVYARLPARWVFRFIYMYFIRLGFLDGRVGLHFCLFISSYEQLIQLRMLEIRRGIAAQGDAITALSQFATAPKRSTRTENVEQPPLIEPAPPDEQYDQFDPTLRQVSPWATRAKIARLLWSIVEQTLFRYSFRTMYRWRAFLLRRFGAKIGRHCIIRRSVRVEVPWHFSMGDYSTLGDECIVYSLGRITLGDRVTISQYSYICAGTHDHTRPDFPLLRPPIVIEDDVWIAADVFIGPDVRIGRGALVGARSSVFKDLPPWRVCVGNPAKPVKDRQYHGPREPTEGPAKPRLVV